MIPRILVLALLGMFALISPSVADSSDTRWIQYQPANGDTEYLADNRQPALFTGNFGDCLGDSLVNVTRFDAAYYQDNMTVLFHLEGSSALMNESVMIYIGVFAYGESRFDLTFNPCLNNIPSLCPINSSIPISADGIIPVSQNDVANVPNIAFSIPDFEGEAILRIFNNATQSEIGCYSAVVTNGNSFSQPASVGTVLGFFTFVALVASFATAAYGEAVPTMRLHYAHSLSVGVVFAVFQHIFYTGALSMNWPSCLVAWWSNFAWAGGMINTSAMQSAINNLIGNNVGNTSSVGAAPAGSTQESLGGGYDLSQIYGRSMHVARAAMQRSASHPMMRDLASEIYSPFDLRRTEPRRRFEHALARRDDIANASSGFPWYGHPVDNGLPLPGNYSGFAGTLAQEQLRVSNAFMTGFLWFLIALLVFVGSTVALKWLLEGLARLRWIKQHRLAFFRKHWRAYAVSVLLRTCFISFFMIMLLTIFQFTYESSGAVKGVAAAVFGIFFIGMPGLAIYACVYKKRIDGSRGIADNQRHEQRGLLAKVSVLRKKSIGPRRDQEQGQSQQEPGTKADSKPFWSSWRNIVQGDEAVHKSIHDDEDYTIKFGWLAARYRRSRWWFFTFWLLYEFVRAAFYGGASGYPLVQVFGLLIVEIIAFVFILWAKPFEGRRLNLLVVYCLGFSKVTTVALSAAFDVQFNLQRITTTIIGILIIIIQGFLVIITLIAILAGAATSYMSVSRNSEDFHPRKYAHARERYFDYLDRVVNDLPPEPKPEPPPPPPPEPKTLRDPYFEMKAVRRMAKIEDEGDGFTEEPTAFTDRDASGPNIDSRPGSPAAAAAASPANRSRAVSSASMRPGSLPYGARPHRKSWSTRDFDSWHRDETHTPYSPIDMGSAVLDDEPIAAPAPPKSAVLRAPSRSSTGPLPPATQRLRGKNSNESIGVGGDVSTRDVIGKVPAPAMRPRAANYGSGRNTSTMGQNPDAGRSVDVFYDAPADPQSSRSRQASRPALSPAQETEEFPRLDA